MLGPWSAAVSKAVGAGSNPAWTTTISVGFLEAATVAAPVSEAETDLKALHVERGSIELQPKYWLGKRDTRHMHITLQHMLLKTQCSWLLHCLLVIRSLLRFWLAAIVGTFLFLCKIIV